MPIRCKCEACGKAGRVPDSYAGLTINCPACGESMYVPTLEEAAAAEKNAPAAAAKPAAPKPAAPPAPKAPAAPAASPKPAPTPAPAPAKPAIKPSAPTMPMTERRPAEPAASKPAATPKPAEKPRAEATPPKAVTPPAKPAAPPAKAPPAKAPAAPTLFEKAAPKAPPPPSDSDDLPELDGLDLPSIGDDNAPAMLDLGDFEEPASKPAAKAATPEKPAAKAAAPTVFDKAPAKPAPAPAKAAASIIDDEDDKPSPAPQASRGKSSLTSGPLLDLGLAALAAGLAAFAWLGSAAPPLARPVASATVGAAPSASVKVEIDGQNSVKVNGSAVAGPEAVAAALTAAGTPQQILIQASGEALYGTVERVIAAAGRGGVVNVQLATLE